MGNQGHDQSVQQLPRNAPPRVPGWVKVFGVIAVILLLLVVVSLVLGIRHGPGLHGGSSSGEVAALPE